VILFSYQALTKIGDLFLLTNTHPECEINMADQALNRFWFPLSVSIDSDAGRVKSDPYGFFSCRANVARFLEIESKNFNGILQGKVKEDYTRTLTLADGTKLASSSKDTDKKVEGSRVTLRRIVGRKRVVLKTGKVARAATGGKPETYHTVSFAFPTWATADVISEALAELIPANKIDAKGGETKVFPYFKLGTGGTYPIMSNAAAIASPKVQTSAAALKTKIEGEGGKVIN
jgi:hypothetical protein